MQTFQSSVTATLVEVTEQISRDPKKALDTFVSVVECSEPMKTMSVIRKGEKQGIPWFNAECNESIQRVKRLLKRLKKTKVGGDRMAYVT